MKWRSRRVSLGALIFLAVLGAGTMALVELSAVRVKRAYYDEKVEAGRLAQKAASAIRAAKTGEKIVVDPVTDPNATGLIGEQFTIITTDRGSLTSKLTATNPNWAAVVVDMLGEVGVKKGDAVAVSYTGSMPGLNIAVLAALETIGAKPIIVSSVGSSMWGANNPELTWLDMEKILVEKGIFKSRSIAVSLGGRGDRGGNVSPEGRKLMRDIIERNGRTRIEEATLDEAITVRMKIFESKLTNGEKFAAYINVGGGLASVGSSHNLVAIKPGITKRILPGNYPRKGTMILFGEKGVPIINLSEVTDLATKYGLPIAPEPLPDVPHGEVYSETRYRFWLAVIILILYSAIVFALIRIDIGATLFKRREVN